MGPSPMGPGWRHMADILYLDPTAFLADFAGDLPRAEARVAPVTAAAWQRKKSWTLIATRDHKAVVLRLATPRLRDNHV